MTARPLPEPPVLQPAAVGLLTAIRDHLDLPLYAEGDEGARQAYLDLQSLRVADIVAALDDLLGVTVEAVVDTTAALRAHLAETQADYTTAEVDQ